ncbi:hypothetical protein MTF65_25390 [Streptomyces sp. APSN-46.1]|uniref:hypothetical protein n=1 Tax=Streptomyces sp. APSN-46.1 TaxID=2929049 RepID=UPI001FB538A3|nr:hypothetical protein [Streptomyces sp. APSN-46.1]MCJ1680622.1 hypothetical protein [Streptomyces sp. APSN-46.1]
MRGHLTRAVTKACLVLAMLGLVIPTTTTTAAAQRAQVLHRQTVVLPLSGTFRTFGSEPIDVTGSIRVRVVTETEPGGGGTARVTSTLLRTTGIGQVSGDTYRLVGSDTDVVAFPPGPISPLTFRPTFYNIFPPDPIIPIVPPHPIQPVIVRVTLAPDGAIDGIGAQIDPGTVDNP